MSSTSASPVARHLSEPFDSIVRQRRATRHFTSEQVPDEDLSAMLQDAALAPSGFNLQPWRFLVLRNAGQKMLLRRAAADQEKITEAPVVVIAYASHHRWQERLDAVLAESVRRGALTVEEAYYSKRDALAFIESVPLRVWLHRHVMTAVTHLMLAAEVHGWNTAPVERFDAHAIRRAFNFPDETEIVALLAIGRAQEPFASFPGRLPLKVLVALGDLQTPWPGTAVP
jgi:nitroreductase